MMSCITTSDVGRSRSSTPPTSGQIQVIFGPMFSGKTTELMRRCKRFQFANYKCLIIKYEKDDRYDKSGIATHDKQTLPAKATSKLYDLYEEAFDYDVIGVDEGQFFPDTVEFCEVMADKGKTVVVAALDGTFQREGFGEILKLVPLAESVIKLNAVCMNCYGSGAFTKRKGKETAVEVIGGADKYLAVCRACHKSPKKVSPMCSPRSKTPYTRQTDIGEKQNAGRRLFGTPLTNVMDMD